MKTNNSFKFFLLLFCLWNVLIFNNTKAQTTYFNGNGVNAGSYSGRLYSVEIDKANNRTLVTIELVPYSWMERLNIFTSWNTTVESGSFVAKIKGIKVNGEVVLLSSCSSPYGWNYVNEGGSYRYTLVFDGAIPPGLTNFNLISKEDYNGCRGFSFKGYTLNNPNTLPHDYSLTESKLKQCIDNVNDGIVGIYEQVGGEKYKVACIKENGIYKLVYMSGGPMGIFRFGDVKATMRETSALGFMKASWYMGNKQKNDETYITFDGVTMKVMVNGIKDDIFFIKMYPTTSSNQNKNATEPQEWSGTGFALNRGYIVTNYHVVEDAKSIVVCGINGDFNVSFVAEVVATDKVNDIAIIKINDSRFKGFGSLPYSIKMQMAEVGDDIFVLGYPLTQTMGDEIKLTNGIISSRTGFEGDASLYQMSAPIQPGNSGGPMFDSKGNVIGIVCAHHKGAENVGYAIKTSYLKNLAETSSLTNIFPTINTIFSLPLSGQVKKLKRFVYLIKCSTQPNKNSHQYSRSYTSNGVRIVDYPKISSKSNNSLTIKQIRLSKTYTSLEIIIMYKPNFYTWCRIDSETCISANGKKLKLTKAEGISIAPQKTYFENEITFKLFFPPIPAKTNQIDLSEPDEEEGAFKIYGIKLQ